MRIKESFVSNFRRLCLQYGCRIHLLFKSWKNTYNQYKLKTVLFQKIMLWKLTREFSSKGEKAYIVGYQNAQSCMRACMNMKVKALIIWLAIDIFN